MDRVENNSEQSERIALSLGDADRAQASYDQPMESGPPKPIVGWIAVGTGLLSVFVSFMFIPFAFAFSVASFFVGQGRWGMAGLVLTVLGVVTSATVVAMLGLGALFALFGMPI